VVSVNGATRLIQGHEFFTQAVCELSVIQSFQTFSLPTQDLNQAAGGWQIGFPLVLTSAITGAGPV